MPCLYPMPAARNAGTVALWPRAPQREGERLEIPCGRCVECRKNERLGWALRCKLEAGCQDQNTFVTLTYRDEDCPDDLQPKDLQRFHKRLRRLLGAKKRGRRKYRHFCCGEYGEQTNRPHYHGLLFGLCSRQDKALIEEAWGHGHIVADEVNIARIHYITGYTTKKLALPEKLERIDYETGEVIVREPPFRTMSKNPGIGANAMQWRNAWRTHAVLEGRTISVPRYLKQKWKDTATQEEIDERELQLQQLKDTRARTTGTPRTWEEAIEERDRERAAIEAIAGAQQKARLARRA